MSENDTLEGTPQADDNAQEETPVDAAKETEITPPKVKTGDGTPWGRLFLVAVVAAVLGALTISNWYEMPFSLLFVNVKMAAGIMILACAGLGFILGVVFLWSALDKD